LIDQVDGAMIPLAKAGRGPQHKIQATAR